MNIEFYWNTLKSISKAKEKYQIENIPEQDESIRIFAISFAQIIKSGIRFNFVNQTVQTEEEKKSGFIKIKQNKDEEIKEDDSCIEISDPSGVVYKCNCIVLKNIMKDDYDKYILKIDKNEKQVKKETEKIIMPDIFNTDDEKAVDTKTPDKEEKEQERDSQPDYTNKDRLPEFFEDTNYTKDDVKNGLPKKSAASFLYNKHLLTFANGSSIEFCIYPLKVKADSPITDVFVAAVKKTPVSGSRWPISIIRANVSRGISSSVNIEFDEKTKFIIRGAWKNGIFSSQVNPLSEKAVEYKEITEQHVPTIRTSTTYLRTNVDGHICNAFPVSFLENDKNGYAYTAVAVEDENNVIVITPTESGDFIISGKNGSSDKSLTFNWTGDNFLDSDIDDCD